MINRKKSYNGKNGIKNKRKIMAENKKNIPKKKVKSGEKKNGKNGKIGKKGMKKNGEIGMKVKNHHQTRYSAQMTRKKKKINNLQKQSHQQDDHVHLHPQ